MRPSLEEFEVRLVPSTFMVTTNADITSHGATPIAGSLRAAVDRANATPGADTIQFILPSGSRVLGLNVNDTNNPYAFGPTALVITDGAGLTITGNQPGVTISGLGQRRVFAVMGANASLTLQGVTVTGGAALGGAGGNGTGGGGGGGAGGMGGAVFVGPGSTFTLQNSTLTGNQAVGGNGGNVLPYARQGPDSSYGAGGGGGGVGGPGGAATNGQAGGGGGGVAGAGSNGHLFGGGFGGPNEAGVQAAAQASGTSGGGGGGGDGGGAFATGVGGSGTAESLGGFGGGGGGGGYGLDGLHADAGPGGWSGGGGGGGYTALSSSGGTGGFGGGGGGGGVQLSRIAKGASGGFGAGAGAGQGGSSNLYSGGGGGGGGGLGGAIFNLGGVTIQNSTLSGNTAQGGAGGSGLYGNNGTFGYGLGGAVFNLNGVLNIQNSTLSGNTTTNGNGGQGQGGGVYNLGYLTSGSSGISNVHLYNNIIAGNANTQTDVKSRGGGTVTANTNLINAYSGFSPTNNIKGGNLGLGPLANNGGPTQTMAINSGSLGFGKGNASVGGGVPATDQRGAGFARVVDGALDLGAFQVQAATPAVQSLTVPSSSAAQAVTLTAKVTAPGGVTVDEGVITFTVFGKPLPPVAVKDGVASVRVTVPAGLAIGKYSISAVFTDTGSSAHFRSGTGSDTLTVQAAQAMLRPDPQRPGKQMLVIFGTGGNDTILVRPRGASATTFLATINGASQTIRGVTGRILVFGLNGNDDIALSRDVRKRTELNGGAGDDTITGGGGTDFLTGGPGNNRLDGGAGVDQLVEAGDADMRLVQGTAGVNGSLTSRVVRDVLVGNRIETAQLTGGASANVLDASAFTGNVALIGNGGDDTLIGGTRDDILLGGVGADSLGGGLGRDLLIGGLAADALQGGGGDDILIGGLTAYDANPAALDAVIREWSRTDVSYARRIQHLRGTRGGSPSGPVRLNATTVFDDREANRLTGGPNRNWFFRGARDILTDLDPDTEVVTNLSWPGGPGGSRGASLAPAPLPAPTSAPRTLSR